MLHTEYVRSLNCNYERILLDKKPEEKRYQYCILNRGGIKGLLPCSLRYINGLAYLYYDISSRQNVTQLYNGRSVTRKWISDFMWSLKQIQQELSRFLLDIRNILWYPEQIYQDLESNIFSFIYVPYYEGEESFIKLIEFLVEYIDYDDEVLVDCVYHMYEQLERNGMIYLQAQIFEDIKCLEEKRELEMMNLALEATCSTEEGIKNITKEESTNQPNNSINQLNNNKNQLDSSRNQPDSSKSQLDNVGNQLNNSRNQSVNNKSQPNSGRNQSEGSKNQPANSKNQLDSRKNQQEDDKNQADNYKNQQEIYKSEINNSISGVENKSKTEKKGIFSIFEGRKNRNKKMREDYSMTMQQVMSEYAVAEDVAYHTEDYGRTVYIEEKQENTEKVYALYTPEGRLLASIDKSVVSVGKKKEEVDVVLDDSSVSRIHARITDEKGDIYLEDLNSTNGTFKNGLRMQPYEKRKLEQGDEIKCGKVLFIFR